jgi:hypothetical protein
MLSGQFREFRGGGKDARKAIISARSFASGSVLYIKVPGTKTFGDFRNKSKFSGVQVRDFLAFSASL